MWHEVGGRRKCDTVMHSTATNSEIGAGIKLPNTEMEQILPDSLLTSFVVDAVKL